MHYPKRGKFEPFCMRHKEPKELKPRMARVPLRPHLRIVEDRFRASCIIVGSDLEAVRTSACNMVCNGYVPVEDEYFLMEHKKTKRRSNFRRIVLVKPIFLNE